MRRTYTGAICEGNGTFGIAFPDFLGCISAGDTLEQVTERGHEALQFHVDGMVEDGEAIPEPHAWTLEAVAADFDDPDDPIDEQWIAVVPIEVNVQSYPRAVPVEVDTSLILEIDSVTENRRQFIMDATRRELDRLKQSA